MLNDRDYQKIEAYLGGAMSSEEIVAFEKEMDHNEDLRKEVQLYDRLNHHLGKQNLDETIPDNTYTQQLKTFIQSEEGIAIEKGLRAAKEKYDSPKTKTSRINYKAVAAIAAILIIGFFGIYLSQSTSSERLYLQYYSIEDLPSVVKRGETKTKISAIVSTFRAKDYQSVIDLFMDYEKTAVAIDTSMFLYKGMAHLELNEMNDAIAAFEVMCNSRLLDRSKGLWFKALAYLKQKDIENARKTLEIIAENPQNFRHKEAKELLGKL